MANNRNRILAEAVIAVFFLGGGLSLMFIDCLKHGFTVINMGVSSRSYLPTTLSGIGIALLLFYAVYLVARFVIKRFARYEK
ncbi:MAG: hypothetical protein PHS37_01785 [Candidatus Omnitrophica bacterium]|nr:hypothetical protein [Candidatus Omnitrophota bacterium]